MKKKIETSESEDEKALANLVNAAAGMFEHSNKLKRIEEQVKLMEARENQLSQSSENGVTEPDEDT